MGSDGTADCVVAEGCIMRQPRNGDIYVPVIGCGYTGDRRIVDERPPLIRYETLDDGHVWSLHHSEVEMLLTTGAWRLKHDGRIDLPVGA